MRKWLTMAMVAVLCVAVAVPSVTAAEAKPKAKKPAEAAKPEAKGGAKQSAEVKQGELAQLLVQVLGLSRFLPPKPSYQQCFAALLHNSISPLLGWDETKIVTKADLARVIVQAMKKQSEIKNPDNPQEWIDYLKSIGVPLDAVGETLSYVEPLPEPVAPHVVSGQVDPLVKRHRFNPTDEMNYGVDMEYIMRVLSQLEFEQGEFRPKPVTET